MLSLQSILPTLSNLRNATSEMLRKLSMTGRTKRKATVNYSRTTVPVM